MRRFDDLMSWPDCTGTVWTNYRQFVNGLNLDSVHLQSYLKNELKQIRIRILGKLLFIHCLLFFALFCFVLFCFVLFCFVLFCLVLSCFVLFCLWF